MSLWSAALDAFFPPHCPGCAGEHEPRFCSDCLARIPAPTEPLCASCGLTLPATNAGTRCRTCLDHPPAFGRARACAAYATGEEGAPLRSVLHRYKYERDLAEAAPLSALLLQRCPLEPRDYDVIVPVPLHLERLRWRGFNQAQLLARPLARHARVPLDAFVLERVRATDPQVRLDAEARRRNVQGAFRVAQSRAMRGKRALLFDDVYTSGATADACARALLDAGAGMVDVLALAHAVLP